MDRAILGIDGNAAFALLGADVAIGEAEFVTIERREDETLDQSECRAAFEALDALRVRLGRPLLSYEFGSGFTV